MRLNDEQLDYYRQNGHLTLPGVFDGARMDEATADAMAWAEETIAGLDAKDRAWYVDAGVKDAELPRKMDDPVFFRPVFRALAEDPTLLEAVRQLIGEELEVAFSQIFFKPPGGGGPKPAHQDNYYFGCDDRDGMVTAWIALDEATVENGCMRFVEGSNRAEILDHVAPEGEPFNLLIPEEALADLEMTPAPVPRGGVSFHHGNTIHRSSDNCSDRWRRACAVHYVNAHTRFATPALSYNTDHIVAIA